MIITDPVALGHLQAIAGSYGTACVITTLYNMALVKAATDYANNPDAVIHRDVATLGPAIEQLKLNHPLRMVQPAS